MWGIHILLMKEILHHLGCMKPCKPWNICNINWLARCFPSRINSSTTSKYHFTSFLVHHSPYNPPQLPRCFKPGSPTQCRAWAPPVDIQTRRSFNCQEGIKMLPGSGKPRSSRCSCRARRLHWPIWGVKKCFNSWPFHPLVGGYKLDLWKDH